MRYEIKAMSRDFSWGRGGGGGGGGGREVIKSADKRRYGRAFSILTTENEEIFILKVVIIANYGSKWSLLLFWMQ